ncbi:TetR family transcriptional regulator [Methylophaga sp. 42_25_T18]|nr:TetR family transcriptional regulator [Methylophaga sp. 42_25_T18]
MRYKPEQKKETHEKIIAAAGRSFRKNGFSGIGVDGLAKEAGVTSGAFYKHFPSKKAAFETIVVEGLQEVQQAILGQQQAYGDDWWKALAEFYVTEKRTCDAKNSCGLQSLTSEVSRGDDDLKLAYEQELLKIASIATEGDDGAISADTWEKLALLIGGVTMARAVNDAELSEQIGLAVQNSVLFK